MMATESHISLLDLSKQFNYEIDDEIKNKICFAETLIISCGHYEGDSKDDSSDSEWSCDDSSESKISDPEKQDKAVDKALEKLEEEPQKVAVEEEEDFHFYFFPDCTKPIPPTDSKASLIVEDGFPKINQALKKQDICTCAVDKSGKCPCHLKVPCKCGAKTRDDCTCLNVENICICEEGNPRLVCTCQPSEVCLCHPDCKPRPLCTCSEVNKPCICHRGKYPCPICVCECKPNLDTDLKVIKDEEFGEESSRPETKASTVKSEQLKEPCTCQKVKEPKPVCYCLKGRQCICPKTLCICGVQPTCICEPTESGERICGDEESKTICVCPKEPECTCYAKSPEDCKCFPKPQTCTCGNPEDCVCFSSCDCVEPCLCDITPKKEDICTCVGNTKKIAGGIVCTCLHKKDENKKLKRVRAGKHGYRWCHDVDPKHTFFGFAYERHDKISTKEQDRERFKILGLYDEPIKEEEEEVCAIHGSSVPKFKKKVKKPSLDCCSAVGGISISVETLGEDKDKFLVQVVSHACKEGAKTGSKLVGILDCNLHTLEENRTEHITKKDLTKEHRSYISICEDGYYNKVTRICGERHFVKRFYHSFQDASNFLLEGANVVLLRYFALSRFSGHIKTKTVLIDGTICESVYVSHGVSHGVVNGKPLFVVKVERHIIEPSGFINQTLTALTLRGYIVSHEWADSSYIFHINPLLQVVPEKDEVEAHEPLREKWRNDLQLLSDYLDFKSARSSEGAKYVSESGELTGVIRDYLQTLLLLRPHDALHFTRHYFGSALSALDLPHDEYFDPCTKHGHLFVSSTTSRHITKKDLTKEHRSYISICEDGYYNKVTRICGERHFVKRFYHSFQDASNFLLEGANVVLLRYFALSRFSGHIKTKTVLIDGTICESVYVSHGVSHGVVNGKPLFVVKVERHIIEPSGFINQTLTALTLRGYIVSHEWADSSYIFHINPLLQVVPEKDEVEAHEPLREKWRNDLQLLSDYLDFKSARSSEGAKYVSESGELTGVIRDYLQTLLLLRPHDALHFTRHYFGSALSALDLPHDEYFDPCTKHVRYYFFEE